MVWHIKLQIYHKSSEKQLPSIKEFILKKKLNPEFIDDTERIEEEEDADRSKMLYKGNNKTYDFRKFKTVSVFGNEIRNNINNIRMANDEQN